MCLSMFTWVNVFEFLFLICLSKVLVPLLWSASWACVHVLGVVVEGECSCCGVSLLGFLICRWWEICDIYDVITCYFEVGLWVLWNRIKLLLHWVRLDATCCFQCKVAWITLYYCPWIQFNLTSIVWASLNAWWLECLCLLMCIVKKNSKVHYVPTTQFAMSIFLGCT